MDAYIVKAYRSAAGKAGRGGFKNYRSDDLAVDVIKHLLAETPELDPHLVDDVIVGCANPEGEQGLQIGRQISLRAMGKPVPGMTVNRYCASGLETISIAVAKVKAGMGQIYVAGGTESMSSIPMTGYKLAPAYNVAKDTPDYTVGMGITAEEVASKWNVTREQADEFSVGSHAKAAAAIDAGKFKDEIVPVTVPNVFVKDGKRVETSHVVDTDEGLRLASCSVAGVEPLHMGIGPCAAIPKALTQAGLKLNDIDLIELNEAFATQALAVIKEAGLNPDIVNVNGGAIALGHPLGCTGAKLSTQLFNEMRRRGDKYGMVTACVGGGQGIAGVYEFLN